MHPLTSLTEGVQSELTNESKQILENWETLKEAYAGDELITKVRDKEIRTILKTNIIIRNKNSKSSTTEI